MRLIRPYPLCRLPAVPLALPRPQPVPAKPVRLAVRPLRPNEENA